MRGHSDRRNDIPSPSRQCEFPCHRCRNQTNDNRRMRRPRQLRRARRSLLLPQKPRAAVHRRWNGRTCCGSFTGRRMRGISIARVIAFRGGRSAPDHRSTCSMASPGRMSCTRFWCGCCATAIVVCCSTIPHVALGRWPTSLTIWWPWETPAATSHGGRRLDRSLWSTATRN
jgi:hypothetical protein